MHFLLIIIIIIIIIIIMDTVSSVTCN